MKYVLQAVAMLISTLVAAGCNKTTDPESIYRDAVALWAKTQHTQRRLALRVHGIEHYAPCRRTVTGSSLRPIQCANKESFSRRDVLAWGELLGRAEAAIATNGNSSALAHARALARLWQLSGRSLRLAEEDLKKALELAERQSPRILNDLAIVRRLRADFESRPELLIHSLDSALAAAEGDRSPTVLFNVAWLQTESGLRRLAKRSWREVLAGDPESAWASEVYEALADLATSPICTDLERILAECLRGPCQIYDFDPICGNIVVSYLQDDLLPAWTASTVREDRDRLGATAKTVLSSLGRVQKLGAIGRLTADLLEDCWTGTCDRWAPALRDYAEGRQLLARIEVDQAERRLLRARERAPAGSTLALLIDFELARTKFMHRSDFQQAIELFQALEQRTESSNFWHLRGDLARYRGLAEGSLGLENACRESYAIAQERYQQSQSELAASVLHSLQAENDFFVGRPAKAWETWLHGMRRPGARMRDRIAYDLLSVAAFGIQNQGLEHVGLALTSELVEVGAKIAAPAYIYQAHLRRGTALKGLGRSDDADADLQRAEAAANKFEQGNIRQRALSDLALFRAELLTATDPHRAVELLSDSLTANRNSGLRFFLPRILSARADAYRRLGDLERAHEDLSSGISELETVISHLDDRDLRISFLDRRREIFDRLIDLELETSGDPKASLAIAEQARVRTVTHTPPVELSASGLQSHIQARDCLLYYRVLPDRLLIWVGSKSRFEMIEVAVNAPQLRRLAQAVLEGLSVGAGAIFDNDSARLHALLFPPATCAQASDRLLLVPDNFLFAVPFAALKRSNGHYLLEERSYRLLPGLPSLSRQPRRPAESTTPQPLALASSQASTARYPSLAPLVHAEAEAAAVIAIYATGRQMTGDDLQRDNVVKALQDATIFHYAGHAATDFEYPLRSALLIGETEFGELTAADLSRLRLPNLNLVFLSSCQAMNGPASGSAGALSLAQAFIASGARAVVASVTDVEDGVTAELSAGFHRRFAAGMPASQALRSAQLELLRNGRPLATWAGYSLLGEEIFWKNTKAVRLKR